MKKRMRMSALLAGAMMLCTVCPAVHAEEAPDLYYFGIRDSGTFQRMQPLDDKGLLQSWARHANWNADAQTPYTFCAYHNGALTDPSDPEYYIYGDMMYLAVPRQNTLCFTLRKDSDQQEAAQKCQEIAAQYFPDSEQGEAFGTYEICAKNEAEKTDENAERLMHALADAHLIDAFYTWGETADYILIEHGFLTVYALGSWRWAEKEYDWAAIEAWVQEKHPECEFVSCTDKESALAKTLSLAYFSELNKDQCYAVIPPEGTAFADHFALAMELYEQFDLDPFMWPSPLETGGSNMTGKNALALAGDVNLDCAIDVSDAVLTARYLAEDKTVKIADQGLQNADADGNGSVTPDDITAVLEYITKRH